MLSLTCKASIKAVVYLVSKLETNEMVSIKDVAKEIDENEHTVGKLLQKLVKGNIIKSNKGPKGGFYVTPEQTQIKIVEIIKIIDGEEVFTRCGLGLRNCSETRPCPIHTDYKVVRDLFKNLCIEKKVYELYENVNNGMAYLTV